MKFGTKSTEAKDGSGVFRAAECCLDCSAQRKMQGQSQEQNAAEGAPALPQYVFESDETHGAFGRVQTAADREGASIASHSERMQQVKHVKADHERDLGRGHERQPALIDFDCFN